MLSLPPGKTWASSLGYGFQDEDTNESRFGSEELHDLESRLEQSRTEMRDEDVVLLYVKFLCKTMVLLISFFSGRLWRIEQKLAHSVRETSNSLQNYGIIHLQDHGNNDRILAFRRSEILIVLPTFRCLDEYYRVSYY